MQVFAYLKREKAYTFPYFPPCSKIQNFPFLKITLASGVMLCLEKPISFIAKEKHRLSNLKGKMLC